MNRLREIDPLVLIVAGGLGVAVLALTAAVVLGAAVIVGIGAVVVREYMSIERESRNANADKELEES